MTYRIKVWFGKGVHDGWLIALMIINDNKFDIYNILI